MNETADRAAFPDHVQPFQIEGVGVRGRLVRLGPALAAILKPHRYPAAVAAVVAETLALAAVLASGLKYDGIFTLQLHGDGPLRLIVVDVTSEGHLRAYARVEADRIEQAGVLPGDPIPRLFGNGRMVFTVDQGPHTERYQGITGLEGATLGDCAHAYFRQSEQLQTAIKLCATETGTNARTPRAAALMVQRLPSSDPWLPAGSLEAADEDWRRSVILMSGVTSEELLAPELSSAQVLYRLFHEDGVRVFRQRDLRHRCRCSRERVMKTLRSFPREDVVAMADDGRIVVTCEFCKAEYTLLLDDVCDRLP